MADDVWPEDHYGFLGMPAKTKENPMPILDPDSDLAWQRRRDDNARAAMRGMLAHPTRYKPRPGAPENWHDAIAEEAYEIADAMERARQS